MELEVIYSSKQKDFLDFFLLLVFLAAVLEVANDGFEHEVDDPHPHSSIGVAVGWRLVKVNQTLVNDLKSINAAFKKAKSSIETIFIKVCRIQTAYSLTVIMIS